MSKKSKQQILYPNNEKGIYLYEYVKIGGIQQYIQIRGVDKKNPLILFLHGGPGGSLAGLCHVMQSEWETTFTVVNWDQRNACKTYVANKMHAMDIGKTGSMEDYINDIDEVIQYLHTVYEFEKLILLGFSWGSIIGAEYAKLHPEHIAAYVGVGQLVNYYEGFEVVCEEMLKLAKDEKTIAQIKEMQKQIANRPAMTKEWMKKVQKFVGLSTKYIAKDGKAFPVKAFIQSPFLNFVEKKAMLMNDIGLYKGTFETLMAYDFRENMSFSVPVVFISGDEDTSCPVSLLQECYAGINAPKKELFVMNMATHTCFYDKPKEFWELLNSVLS